jgi:acetyl-CoA carboxylase biotin carboxyl carrier protein
MKKKTAQRPRKAALANPEMAQIQQLLKFMEEHGLEEFEYTQGSLHIRFKKPSAGVAFVPRAVAQPEIIIAGGGPSAASEQSSENVAAAAAAGDGQARPSDDLHTVKSPIVGTFYGSPSPGAEPFVKIGSHVDAGQTLCIIEAMKLMNEIESDTRGEVLRIFAENGQPVEYGQPLFGIRPSRKK